MSDAQREMSLVEYTKQLPKSHRVNEELDQIYMTLAFLNSMIYSGEGHSEFSKSQVDKTFDILRGKS